MGQYVGEKIVVNMLIESLGQTPSQIEAVGHSLGAHLVGHLGRTVYDITGQKISRVTGNLMSMYVQGRGTRGGTMP